MSETNWNKYYQKPYKTAVYTRKITGNKLVSLIKRFSKHSKSIIELGGANSSFFEMIQEKIKPEKYYAIDNNASGLEKLKNMKGDAQSLLVFHKDIFELSTDLKADIVFSIGLIEHFNKEGTKKAIQAHFKIAKENGIVIISFPTPTLLYKMSRFLSESLGLWIFHDERPLKLKEVLSEVCNYGSLLHYSIIWPIFFTQGIMVIRKTDSK